MDTEKCCSWLGGDVVTDILLVCSETGIWGRELMDKKWPNMKEEVSGKKILMYTCINPYPTAFPYGNGMVLHFYQQQESSTTKTVHKVINKGLKAYV